MKQSAKAQLSLRLFAAAFLSAALAAAVPADSHANNLRPRTRISLMVAGQDPAHVAKQLGHLQKIAKLPDVLVGSVYVHGFGSRLKQTSFRPVSFKPDKPQPSFSRLEAGVRSFGPQYRTLYESGLRSHKFELASQVFSRVKPKYSPTWIVRHRGKDYIFEGLQNPGRLFSRTGIFLQAAARY